MTEAETDYIYEELVKIENLVQDLSLHLYDRKKEKNGNLLAFVDHDKLNRINKILSETEYQLVGCMQINAEGLEQTMTHKEAISIPISDEGIRLDSEKG